VDEFAIARADSTDLARAATGAPLGHAAVRYQPSAWEQGREAELEDLFVIAAARRRGVGRRLVQAVVAAAAARGCRKVGLQTNERNAPAVALYGRLGFAAERARWEEGRQLWLERRLAVEGPVPADERRATASPHVSPARVARSPRCAAGVAAW
jgi:ribosomal protein S18 acetylase RimI-like enzyme